MPGSYSTKSSPIKVTWGGADNFSYTLTASAVASDAIEVPFAKRTTLYVFYAAGAAESGNTVDITVWVNPYDYNTDPTGVYWAQLGNYQDSGGTFTEEAATFRVAQGTAEVYHAGDPISLTNIDANQIRITAKENGVASNYGSIRAILVKNEIT